MIRAKERLSIVVPITFIIILFLLYLNFRKLSDVFLIMGFLPFALGGGAWFLYILNYNLSVAVGVGFIALAGIAVESGVVMLEFLNKAVDSLAISEKDFTRKIMIEKISEAATQRVRPIMMTTCSTLSGLIPIMFISGTASEIMTRVAAPMIGGMINATILTLIVIPAVFLIWKQYSFKNTKKMR